MLIWRLAWRNLWRHRGRSLVVGGILFLGALLLTFGNGVVSGMEDGLRRQVVESFTGDVVVASDKQLDANVFLSMMGKEVEPLYRIKAVRGAVDSLPWVKGSLPIGKNMTLALHENEGSPGYVFLLGVDFKEWQAFFPGAFQVKAGHLPQPGEAGLLMPTGANEQLFQTMGQIFAPEGPVDSMLLPEEARRLSLAGVRHDLVLMGYSNTMSASDQRMKVLGLGKYRSLNTIWGHFALCDIESYRSVQGYHRNDEVAKDLSESESKVLSSENLDALLSDGDLASQAPTALAAQTESVENAGVDPIWNLLLVKISGKTPEAAAKELDSVFQARKLPARALAWHQAVGVIGSMALLIRGALLGFVGLLFVVAAIVIANTLAMSAMERASEIGMMRAVGATRTFIARLMLAETSVLAAVFGGAGVFLGVCVVAVIPMLGITTGNDLLQMVYGGEVFHPLMRPMDIFLCLVELGGVVCLASLYPMKIAASITPLDAIARD